LASATETRQIRLRNETITTPPRTEGAAQAAGYAAQAPAAGLFLVQFDGTMQPGWQAELRSLGVELLKYVPDDAFITRFNKVPPARIRGLNYVRWVGPYRANHKVHPRLSAAAQAAAKTKEAVSVNTVVSPLATAAEIADVRSLFSAVVHENRLREGVFLQGRLPAASLDALSQSSVVLWVERAPQRRLVDEQASKLVGGDDGYLATPTVSQQLGFDGAGVTVCVADTGLDTGDTNTMHPDLFGRVTGFKYYGANVSDGSDGYGHGTHCAGIVAGNAATGETDPDTGALYGLGVASGANLFIQRIFDGDAIPSDPFPSDATLTQDAVRNGADIGSNSWGNDVQGEYDTDAWQFDQLVRDADPSADGDQPYILEFSSGNAGPDSQTVGSPATAKNVIATGASQNVPGVLAMSYGLYADGPDTMADFSSRGPCEDGRIKPDVVAPGTWIASAASIAADNIGSVAWTAIDSYYIYMGGTSMSGPHASGAAAVFVQYYKSLHANAMPSPALVKAALINSANPLDELNGGPGPIPNHEEGWGRVTLTNIIFTNLITAPRYYQYVDQTALLTNGEEYVHHTLIQNSDQPLKITLAYTDVAGFPGAIPALVNDLDLEVVAPDGTLYRGNQFTGSESAPNAPSPDTLNNVEAVHLAQPVPGDYLVRVRARRIVRDARIVETAAIDQDFALVVSGNIARPVGGSVILDRAAYTAPGVIQVTVFDPARAASNTVSVLFKSTSEPAGESFLLHASGSYGAFTGAVATVVGGAVVDGKLGIQDGDAIEARYVDSSGATRLVMAVADLALSGPIGVTPRIDLGVVTITWQTLEPTAAIVYYGTNFPLNQTLTNSAFTTTHSVRLRGLVPGQTYSFYVVAMDAAGNAATNNNSGAYFTFVGVTVPTVLLVDTYEPVSGSPEIPDSSYTNALAAAGFSFAHWKVSARGSPQLSDLRVFPAVVWRTIDDVIYYGVDEDGFADPYATNNTINPQQQSMIQDYLDGGGSFFMASMGILSRLGNVPFRKNVLQVGGFKQNSDPLATCADCDEDYGVPAILGTPGDLITSGIYVTLDYTNYPGLDLIDFLDITFGPDFSDTFTPGTNATPILCEAVSRRPCGMSYPRVGADSPGRVVFLSFPLDTVPATGAPPNNEATLLRNILTFLTPGANGVGSIYLNHNVFTAPAQVIVEMGDSDLAGTGQAQATFWASSGTNQVNVVLRETTRRGLFRGFLTLTVSNAANQLTVRGGDIVTGAYFDASNGSNATTTAMIDIAPPLISEVAAVTGYGDATVTWTTSKPADSLVQYGESVLLGRTAYSGDLVTNHSVTLAGLLARRDYYYQVVSRDDAGNTTVDNNTNALYTFTTRLAPRPPFFDDLEQGAADWTVVPDAGSDLNWSLGRPNNGLQTSAHSGTNAWGTNLREETLGFFEIQTSILCSPWIDLSGFSSATLTFWHCYDFISVLNLGAQIGVRTDSSMDPADVPGLADHNYVGSAAVDWHQETVDLTPFVGRNIQVVWWYVAFGDGQGPMDGWLMDDFRFTGVAGGGTIVVSKNLGQGQFTLSGPISQVDTTPLTTITNAPPGPYTIHFSDVAFHQTPPDQSGVLTNEETLTFTGNYVFIDINRNGISDSWERHYFGVATTNRTQLTDSDGDGMPDYAEFIAGTNPTNAASKLIFLSVNLQSNNLVQLEWSAIPGRLYQVETSAGLAPAQELPSLSGLMDHSGGAFKLRVDAHTNMPCAIQVSTNLVAWTPVFTNVSGGQLEWTDPQAATSARRFYRVLAWPASSAGAGAWTPVSDWLQASGSPMYYTTTNASQGAHFYRVQARP